METRIYMVRHADSPFVFGQERSRGLSEQGHEDALKVADVLDSLDFIVYVQVLIQEQYKQFSTLLPVRTLPLLNMKN